MNNSFIAELFELNNKKEFELKGKIKINLLEDNLPFIILQDLNSSAIYKKFPITKQSNIKYTKEDDYDLLINNQYGFRFDKNSSVSFDIFQYKLEDHKNINKNLVCEYYDNNRIKNYGIKNKDDIWDGFKIEYYNKKNNSIKFKGEMEDGEYCNGTFYSKK